MGLRLRGDRYIQPEDVMRAVTIRGEPHTVLQAITGKSGITRSILGKSFFSPSTSGQASGKR